MRNFEAVMKDLTAHAAFGAIAAILLGVPILWAFVALIVVLDLGVLVALGTSDDPPSPLRVPLRQAAFATR